MRTLRAHSLIGGAIFATVFATSTVMLMSAIGDLRHAADHRVNSHRLISLAAHIERLVVDLETGRRGFIITGQERFLQPWRAARQELPERVRTLVAAGPSDPQLRRRLEEIASRVRSYVRDYAVPTVATARREPGRAGEIVSGGEGKRRVDDLRGRFDEVIRAQGGQAAEWAREADAASARAITISWAGIGGLLIGLVLFGLYMVRQVSRPIARIGGAADRVAAGDLSATVAETGPAELSRLARSFNEMARSLEHSREKVKDRNAELDAARLAAERASHAKSEFSSRTSHELRTPLNGILGFGQLLEMAAMEAPNDRYTEQVLKAGRHLLTLIDELLDLSRIEAGRMSLSLEAVNATDIVTDLLALVRPLAAERHVALYGPCSDEPAWVRADQQRLEQVLLTLLSNAIEYNRDEGTVTVAYEHAGPDRLRILVSDTGIGVASDDIDRLFVAFDRLGAEQTDIEGTGLGLTLSRRLVELMEGALTARSEPGVGTTFALELALAVSPADRPTTPPEDTTGATAGGSLPDAAILYIEDNLPNVELVAHILAEQPGIQLIPATTGGLGLQLASARRPDLILLDLHLPDVPGTEILARLRRGETTRETPVIVLSADATPGQIGRLLTAGANGYLTKPLDVGSFLDLMADHLPARPLGVS